MNFKFLSLGVLLSVSAFLSGCEPMMNLDHHTEPLPKVDHILVKKSARTISFYSQNELLRTYNMSLGKSPKGHKEFEGDHKTPEGIYTIASKNPNSKYYRALTLSYPNKDDMANAAKKGKSPGGGVQIHGYEPCYAWVRQHHPLLDATRGCILLTNDVMDQIFDATDVGTKIEIKP